jgi:putative membrane protein
MTQRMLLLAAATLALTMCSPRDRNGETGAAFDSARAAVRDSLAARAGDTATGPTASAAKLDDAGVLVQLETINTVEVQANTAALPKLTDPALQAFARQMAREHTQALRNERQLTQKLGLKPSGDIAAKAADEAAKLMADLEGKTGAEFGKAYIEHEVDAHQKALDTIQHELLPAAQHPELKAHIEQVAPTVRKHLDEAKRLQERIKGAV